MHRTHSHVHFDQNGNPTAIAVELIEVTTGERLSCSVAPVGPFDDFSEVYATTYARACAVASRQVDGQESMFPQDHPRMLLRRSSDLIESPPM